MLNLIILMILLKVAVIASKLRQEIPHDYPPPTQIVQDAIGYFACDIGENGIQKIPLFYLSAHNKYDCKDRYLEIAFLFESQNKTQFATHGFLTDENEGCLAQRQIHSKMLKKN